MLRDSKLPNLSGKHTIAAVGGIKIPAIDDFIVAYEQGAQSVDPGITVLKQYIGGDNPFDDKPKAKEIALALYAQGVDIVFGIAGASGLGVTYAAKSTGKWTIGVDVDEAAWIKDSDPMLAAQILTSMETRIDNSLFRALSLAKTGKLLYGRAERIGLAEGAVGLAKNNFYNANTPDSVKKLVNQAEADVAACKIQVKTAFDKARPCVPTVLTPEPTSAATPVPLTAAPTVAPTQAQTTFSSKIFKLPLSVSLAPNGLFRMNIQM